MSSVFRHFCSPVLYRDIGLNSKEKVFTFLQIGNRSDSLQHTKSFGLIHAYDVNPILERISRRLSLETLRLHRVQFHGRLLTAPSSFKFSDVLILRECHFAKFEYFVTFIRCFLRCETLSLHGCSWVQGSYSHAEPNTVGKVSTRLQLLLGLFSTFDTDTSWRINSRSAKRSNVSTTGLLVRMIGTELSCSGSLQAYPPLTLPPTHLEITNATTKKWGEEFSEQGKYIGMAWLNLTDLKSST